MKSGMRNRFALAVLGIVAVIAAGCGGGATATPEGGAFARPSATLERAPVRTSLVEGTPGAAAGITGKFVFAPGDGSIWVQDPANGKPRPVIRPTAELFADAPDLAPDGKSFVYVRSSLTAQGTAVNEIYRATLDGGENSVLATPTDPKTNYNWPNYSPDGQWVYYTSSYAIPPNKQRSAIERIPAAGGKPETVFEDARMSSVSPDGKQLAFIRFNFDTFTGGLWVAGTDGKNARQLLADDVFLIIAAPEWSPEGSQILFAASGPNSKPLPGVAYHERGCEPQLLCRFAAPAYADGLPWDLWTVTPDGARFKRLTQVGADSPWPTWSRDGKQVAFFDTSGQYLVDVESRTVSQISRNGGHGVFDWWQAP